MQRQHYNGDGNPIKPSTDPPKYQVSFLQASRGKSILLSVPVNVSNVMLYTAFGRINARGVLASVLVRRQASFFVAISCVSDILQHVLNIYLCEFILLLH